MNRDELLAALTAAHMEYLEALAADARGEENAGSRLRHAKVDLDFWSEVAALWVSFYSRRICKVSPPAKYRRALRE